MRVLHRTLLVSAAFGLLPQAARACPVCDTAIGEQVRTGIFNDTFWPTLRTTTIPFPLFLALVAVVHFGIP
jgi:hypothetical protein